MTPNRSADAPSQIGEPILGAHFSIAKGLDQAIHTADRYGCRALQIFTKNASTWKEKVLATAEIDAFCAARRASRVSVVASHTSYLINLAASRKDQRQRSRDALFQEMRRCTQLHIDYVVLHPGAHTGSGTAAGIERIAAGIDAVLDRLGPTPGRLLLETTAGQGSSIGHRFEELNAILTRIRSETAVGICIDTCHIFAAGYDIRTADGYAATMDAFSSTLGLDRLYLMHLNDSKKDFGSRVDRHEHIGHGRIGESGFRHVMQDARLAGIPKIIETPKGDGDADWDAVNLNRLRQMTVA